MLLVVNAKDAQNLNRKRPVHQVKQILSKWSPLKFSLAATETY